MHFSRRRFIGGLAAGSAGLAASPAFALVRGDECPALLSRAMAALDQHGAMIPHRDVMALVDFSVSSGLPRFHIVDVAGGTIAMSHLVAHGSGSDPANSGMVQRFSNRPGSNASCDGAFVTGDTYVGKHGRSRKIVGLDPQNSNALSRAIVIHGADYVDTARARDLGRVGRSQGCFAFARQVAGNVIDRLGPGRLIYAGQ